jgi:hypothetical protein
MQILQTKNKSNSIKLLLAAFLFGLLTTWLILINWGNIIIQSGIFFKNPALQITLILLAGISLSILFFVLFKLVQDRIDLPTVLLISFFILVFFFLLPVGPNVLTFDNFAENPCCHDYDIGFFYSIFHIMSHGEKLYTEVLEIKDPIFFYLNTIFYSLLGQKGPMILEFLLSITMVISLGIIVSRLKINIKAKSILIGVFIFFSLTSPAYDLIHKYHQTNFFLLLIIFLTF